MFQSEDLTMRAFIVGLKSSGNDGLFLSAPDVSSDQSSSRTEELRPLFPTRNAKNGAVDLAELSRIKRVLYFHNRIGVEDIA